jgi:hypothetical protein
MPYQLAYSLTGPLPNQDCAILREGSDPNWGDTNHCICTPRGTPYGNDDNLRFHYQSPTVHQVHPSTAPSIGAINITLIGTSFGISGVVTIGGKVCPTATYNHTYIQCLVPSGEHRSNDLIVSVSGASFTSTSRPIPFYYDPLLTVQSNLVIVLGNESLLHLCLTFLPIDSLTVIVEEYDEYDSGIIMVPQQINWTSTSTELCHDILIRTSDVSHAGVFRVSYNQVGSSDVQLSQKSTLLTIAGMRSLYLPIPFSTSSSHCYLWSHGLYSTNNCITNSRVYLYK